jgi:hypothetical protein
VNGLIALSDQLDAVTYETIAQCQSGVLGGKPDPEMHPRGLGDRLATWPQSQGKASAVVQHQYVIVIAPGGVCTEAEVGLVEVTERA